MPRLRRLSGPDVASIFQKFGFVVHTQRGSHVKLRRFNAAGEKETLTVPNHRELDTGTCHSIFRQASRYIPPGVLRPHFYSE